MFNVSVLLLNCFVGNYILTIFASENKQQTNSNNIKIQDYEDNNRNT